MPWKVERHDTVGQSITITNFEPGDTPFFPTELQNPANSTQPIVIADHARTYMANAQAQRPTQTISSQLVCTNTDQAFVQKIVLTHLKIDTNQYVRLALPTTPQLELHYPSYINTDSDTDSYTTPLHNDFRKHVEKLEFSNLCALFMEHRTDHTIAHSLCPLHLYSKEQLEPLMVLLKTLEIPDAIIQLIKDYSKLQTPKEQSFYDRLAQLTPETIVSEFDSLTKTAMSITKNLSITGYAHEHDHRKFINDEALYKLAKRCEKLEKMDLAKDTLWNILRLASDPNYSNSYISYYKSTATRELLHMILWTDRLPGQVLSSDTIQRLLNLADFPSAVVQDEVDKALCDLMPVYLEIAGFPMGYKPPGIGDWHSTHKSPTLYEERTLDKFLYMLNHLTLTAKARNETIDALKTENAELKAQVEMLQLQARIQTLEAPTPAALIFGQRPASPKQTQTENTLRARSPSP